MKEQIFTNVGPLNLCEKESDFKQELLFFVKEVLGHDLAVTVVSSFTS